VAVEGIFDALAGWPTWSKTRAAIVSLSVNSRVPLGSRTDAWTETVVEHQVIGGVARGSSASRLAHPAASGPGRITGWGRRLARTTCFDTGCANT
jgi:hypothetical protein